MEKGNYPLILEVAHIMEILGVSKRRAYEIMDLNGFPLLRLGRSKRVPRDKFFDWMDGETDERKAH